jgi:hydroxymethylpyrimidine/phosphomethylpyrimidine kinase
MKCALTIAGSDPTGGAGLQADLKVFRAFGVHGLSVPSALTAQNTGGVEYSSAVDETLLKKQLDVLLSDIRPDATKTGMLYTAHAVEAVSDFVKKYSLNNLVIDPVTVSSTGASLMEEGALDAMRSLFPLARVITPNIYEASVFTGLPVEDEADMGRAAISLKEMGPEIVIVTGGHLEQRSVDLYYDGSGFRRFESEKIAGEYHGTGCAFSAAIAALLSLGLTPIEAAGRAKEYVQEAIRRAFHPGRGMGLLYL